MFSVEKRVSVFIMILICFVWDGSSSPCKNPQYIELYQLGVIQCSFENGFVGIQWFNSTEDGTKPIITFVRSEKGGSGYISGNYDILPNGSLIITNVTLQHERVFSVVLAASEDKPTIQYIVRVETIVTPEQPYPTIKQCTEQSTSCYRDNFTPSLNCIVRNVRPEASLTWSQRMVDYDSVLKSELFVTAEHKNTFTSLATVNLTKTIPLLSVFTCKLTGIVFNFDEYEASIIVENTNIHLNTDPIKFNVELYSTMVLPCTELQPNIIVWKGSYDVENISQIIITKVKNWKDDFNTTYNEDFLLGPDGSLILRHVDWHYSGIYSCLVTDYTKMDTKIIDVIVFVNPSPPYLMIEGCNRQQYCVIEVQRGGNITCSIYGIRPAVQLQWRSYDKETDIHFNGEHIKTIQNGDTFDISITTSFKITSTIAERLTLQCLTVGKNSELFQFSTKLDILPIFDENVDVLLSSSGTAWIIAGSIAAIIVVSVIVAILCKVTRRSKTAQNCDNQGLEEGFPMMHSQRETTTATDEKASDKIKEDEADTGFPMMHSQRETTTATDGKTSDKIKEDEADAGVPMMHSQRDKNAMDIAYLFEEISPDKRKLITNAKALFDELRRQTLLHEDKVDVLIEYLDELELSKASGILKDYRGSNTGSVTGTRLPIFPLATEEDLALKKCDHEDRALTYFCVSCDCKVCPECVLNKHKKPECDSFKLSSISEEVSKRRQILLKTTQLAKASSESFMKLWKETESLLGKQREHERSSVKRDGEAFIADVEGGKKTIIKKVEEKEESDETQLAHIEDKIKELSDEVENLKKPKNIPTFGNAADQIKQINLVLKEVENIKTQVDQQRETLKDMKIGVLYKRIPNDGRFCTIERSILIGTVALHVDRLLHICDERETRNGVILACVDCKEHSKEYWRHLVPIDNHNDPVVMSNLTINYDGKHHPVFAVGNKVYIIHLKWTILDSDSVESISSLVINEIPEDSWITSVTAHYPDKPPHYEFVISSSSDQLVREYNVSGSVLREVDTQPIISTKTISSVAYCKNNFAIITRDNPGAVLLDTLNTVKQCGIFKLTNQSGMSPINAMWTGAQWMILYINYGVEITWKVVLYSKAGRQNIVCEKGTSSNMSEAPISITRWGFTGYITFANKKLRKFDYSK